MAGMLPGVGVPHRRKIIINRNNKQIRQDSDCQSPLPVTECREALVNCTISSELDENSLRARQRLHQKLAYLHPSSRSGSGDLPQNKSSGRNNHTAGVKDTRLGSKLLGIQWHLKLRRGKSYKKTCSVCLEDFQDEQQIMKLPCSHKYHSDCVLPWLAAHPHCPYCRKPALVVLL